jgi:hypothetical protein
MMIRNTGILIFFSLLIAAGCTGKAGKGSVDSQNPSDTGRAVLTFEEYEHDFGKVKEDEKIGCIFTFRNTGTSPLVITSAITSCGCTVPKYDTKPISPGDSGHLEVIFNASGFNGIQTKTITVKSNAATPVVLLQIKADVVTSSNN